MLEKGQHGPMGNNTGYYNEKEANRQGGIIQHLRGNLYELQQ